MCRVLAFEEGGISYATARIQSFDIVDTTAGGGGTIFAVVPEPSTAVLVGLGLVGLAVRRHEPRR